MATKSTSELGFAAVLDLRDSTYTWNQDPEIAEQTLSAQSTVAELSSPPPPQPPAANARALSGTTANARRLIGASLSRSGRERVRPG